MLTLKKNKPNLKEMFDKFIEQEEIKEKRLAKQIIDMLLIY